MNMLRNIRAFWVLTVVTVAALPAQVRLGQAAPAVTFDSWLQGEPVAVGGEQAATCTVFCLYGRQPRLLRTDGDYLVALQRRYAEQGLRVAAVVADPEVEGRDRWPGCAIAVDPEHTVADAWRPQRIGHDHAVAGHVLVLDEAGVVAFYGRPGSGLVDAIDAVLAGQVDVDGERNVQALRTVLPQGFDDAVGPDTVEVLQPAVRHAPRDGFLNGLLYVTYATKANDPDAARALLARFVAACADDWRPLAVFADLALRGDPKRPGLAAALREPLLAAAKAARADAPVQLACLRMLMASGQARDAGRQAMRMQKHVLQTADGCLDFATLLTNDQTPEIWRDLATLALDRAQQLGADKRRLLAARYVVLERCGKDAKAAGAVMADYLKDKDLRVGLNNDAWYFMTRLETMGRHDWFAVALVERMLEQEEAMEYFEFDTAALAMFLVGRIDRAIQLQQTALKKGGQDSREYVERLERYKAFRAAAPR